MAGWKSKAAEEEFMRLVQARDQGMPQEEYIQRVTDLYANHYEASPEPTEEESAKALEEFKAGVGKAFDRDPTFEDVLRIAGMVGDTEQKAQYIFSWIVLKLVAREALTPLEREFVVDVGGEEGLRELKGWARNFKPTPGWREVWRKRQEQWRAEGYIPPASLFDGFLETYDCLPRHEKEFIKNLPFGIAVLFGYGEKAQQVKEAFMPKKSDLSSKADALDRLFSEYEQALIEHPEQAKTLKYIYEEEKRKILES